MNARTLSMATRSIRPSTRCLVLRTPMQRRLASSEQQPSHMSQFYKTFTRPVAKVLLLAFFTYQLAYWAWVKLEQDEIVAEREDYIAKLEHEINVLTDFKYHKKKEQTKDPSNDQIRDYKMQLMKLEQRNQETLAAMKKVEEEAAKTQIATDNTKSSPWWKIW